jgi:hypothetical protein
VDIAAPDTMVRWRSTSGVGLALLLIYGVLNVASAVVVPIALEARAVKGLGDGAVILAWFGGIHARHDVRSASP